MSNTISQATDPIGNSATTNGLPSQIQLMSFTVEELLNRIDRVKQAGFGPEPGFTERLFSSGARARLRVIEDAKASSIHARKELIDGLSSCIVIYIDSHKADLKIRGSAFITTTFVTLTGKLNDIVSSVITNFYETYGRSIEEYSRIPNLDDEVRLELGRKALERAHRVAELSESAFLDILTNLKKLVIELSNEIGNRGRQRPVTVIVAAPQVEEEEDEEEDEKAAELREYSELKEMETAKKKIDKEFEVEEEIDGLKVDLEKRKRLFVDSEGFVKRFFDNKSYDQLNDEEKKKWDEIKELVDFQIRKVTIRK